MAVLNATFAGEAWALKRALASGGRPDAHRVRCGAALSGACRVGATQDGVHNAPALWNAAARGRGDLVEILKEAGADVAAVSKVALVPRDVALDVLVASLVQAGATPLFTAASRGHLDVVIYLAEHGANICTPDAVRHHASQRVRVGV